MESAVIDPALRGLADNLARTAGPDAAATAIGMVRERAPDERLAAAMMVRLAEPSPRPLKDLMRDPARAGDLAFCLGASELVGNELCAAGDRWPELFKRACDERAADLLDSIRVELPAVNGRAEAARLLGEFKRQVFLRIVIGDLLGRLSVVDTTVVMSRLADECIRAALDASARLLAAQGLAPGDFCVLAMGKLGAEELNLSSDIDLMYLCGEDSDPVAARRMGETVTEIISAECFRTDLRLRPGGRNSPLVVSLDAALGFYQSLGQTWERAALLRARPVAGTLELGRRMIAELSRFIYRGYLDFDTLRQLRAMKRRIEMELRSPALIDRDIKLGYGGIRELEFIVQALTLIYGGRDPRLRAARTLAALDRLETHGYMAPARARELKAAYLFLRNVEHKLQAAAGLQTHTLPAGAAGLALLAARMGFGKNAAAAERFTRALRDYRELVANQFREMLAGGEERARPAAPAAAMAAWRTASEPAQAAAALAELGFANPKETAAHLELLAHGPTHSPASPRRRELLENLGPMLLDQIAALADPDLALMNLASFIAAVGARTSFLALLEEHPETRRVLLRLFASSGYLSSLFIRHPEMLDTLVRSDLARPRRAASDLSRELAELISACPDFESRLDAIRSFRHQEFLRIAIADLAGDLTLDDVQAELTALAETVLRQALILARDEVNRRRPLPADLKLCAVAMGRLGAREMSYNSDLDLIFIYEGDDAAGLHEIASRVVQKLIAILEARTREGYAYKIDLRLRPSGNAGPLVAPLDGFREYHRHNAAVWERQSLVRARVIAGESDLAEEVEQTRRQFVFERGLTAAEVGEIAAMRARMEREIGAENRERLNLKQGRGGLVDVEFLTQMMSLRHGGRFPAMRLRGTIALLRAIGDAGLFPRDETGQLESDYRFLARLENRLRIETDQAAWALPTNGEQLTPIARRMGYDGVNAAAQLLYEVEERRSRIREIFESRFAREQANR